MLVLTRRIGETIVIDDGHGRTTVKFLGLRRDGSARWGVESPPTTSVLRGELYGADGERLAVGRKNPYRPTAAETLERAKHARSQKSKSGPQRRRERHDNH